MARKTLYDRVDSLGVNVRSEYRALIRLLKVEENIFQYTSYSVIRYINRTYFRDLPADFRSPFLSVEEMMVALGLRDESYSLDDLLLLAEFCVAILPHKYI